MARLGAGLHQALLRRFYERRDVGAASAPPPREARGGSALLSWGADESLRDVHRGKSLSRLVALL